MRQKQNECEDGSPARQVEKRWISPCRYSIRPDNDLISIILSFSKHQYISMVLEKNTRAFQHVERPCGLPNKANVAFAFSFVSPQFFPRIGSPTPSSVSISLPFACPCFSFLFIFRSCCHVPYCATAFLFHLAPMQPEP